MIKAYSITTQREIRRQFWQAHPDLPNRRNVKMGGEMDYPADTRVAFVDYIDYLARNGQISEALAARATL